MCIYHDTSWYLILNYMTQLEVPHTSLVRSQAFLIYTERERQERGKPGHTHAHAVLVVIVVVTL